MVDLGASPRQLDEVVRQRLAGPTADLAGRLVALDLLPMDPLPDVEFIQGDFHDETVERELVDRAGG